MSKLLVLSHKSREIIPIEFTVSKLDYFIDVYAITAAPHDGSKGSSIAFDSETFDAIAVYWLKYRGLIEDV